MTETEAFAKDGLDRTRTVLEAALAAANSVQMAADVFVERLSTALSSAALVRTYATVPAGRLPDEERAFADAIARAEDVVVSDRTPVLVLFATRGARAEWNDRCRSRGHRAIPLTSKLVDAAPMMSRLVQDLGVKVDVAEASGVATEGAGLNRLFYVPSAKETVDERGRNVIPARDFVDGEGIESVFGFGGWFVGGFALATIVFSRERVSRRTAATIATLGSSLKLTTIEHFANGRFWSNR